MTNQDNRSKVGADMRNKAEALARQRADRAPQDSAALSPEDIRKTHNELRVHRIELEMQNEELRTAQAQIEAGRDRYYDLYDLAPVGYCTLSEKGLILEANLTAAVLLCTAIGTLVKQPITRFILKDDQDIYYLHRKKLFETGETQECELRLVKPDGADFWAQLTGTTAQAEDGAPVCRCVLSDITKRKQAEKALKESEGHLRSTLDGLSAHITVLDDQGEIILANKAYRDFGERNGVEPGAVSEGTNYLVICDTASGEHSQEAKPFAEGIREVLSGKRHSFELEYPCHSPEEKRWFVGRVTPIQGEGPRRVVIAHENISERKQAEGVQRESLQRLEFALQGGELGAWDWNPQDGAVVYSDLWAQMLEYRPDEVEPTVEFFKQHVHPEDLAAVLDRLTGHVEGRLPVYESEHRFRTKSGSWLWVLDRGRIVEWDKDGSPVRATGIIADITARKRAEEALREQLDFSESLIETAQAIILVLDTQGRIVRFNSYMENLVGYDFDEVKGMDWIETFIKPDNGNTVKSVFQKTVDDIQTSGNVNPIIAKDGQTILVEWYNKTLKDKDGRTVGILAIGYDITERKQAEAEQEKLQAQLTQAQKMESVGRLAGGVAHDFNNMLSVILGNTELAMENMAPDDPLHNNLSEIFSAARRSADTTRQLLAFARKQTIAPKVLDLNRTIKSMLKMLQRLIGEDIDLAWLPKTKIWPVRMDPSQIDQILANLCINARDAIADVGKITIETGTVTFDLAYCAEHPGFVAGDFALLAVSDNGHGMGSETMSHLFEPFFTTKDLGKGTGLGLATVYGIVKQNDGFINVYSEPDQGTTFRIYLPRYLAETESLEKKNSDKIHMDGTETILLVEDELSILLMTRMMLDRMSYKVLAAGTPGEAIALAREHIGEIHLLMTDVVMPEMNGRALAKNILSLYPHMKCLFMSGYTANVIAHHGVLDEGVQFIQKPFSREQLGTKVREALDEDNL